MIQDDVLNTARKSTYSLFSRFLTVSIWLVLITTILAQAQIPVTGPFVLTSYDIETLASRPGEIRVGTTVQTHLEFDDVIEDVKSARSDWFTIERDGNRLSMRANQGAGRTDLKVISGGRPALFTLIIDEALDVPQQYVIGKREEPAPRVSSSSSEPVKQRSSLAPSSDENHLNQVTDALPTWLEFYAETTYAPGGVVAIHYALANRSSHPVTADVTQLRLDVLDPVAGPQKLPYTLSRVSAEGLTNRVAPGGVEFGTLLVKHAPDLPIQLSWPVVQVGPANFYTLRRMFSEGFNRRVSP